VESEGDGLLPVYFYDDQRPPAVRVSSSCPNLPDRRLVHLDEFLGTPVRPGLAVGTG
jgi:hypothetical protein